MLKNSQLKEKRKKELPMMLDGFRNCFDQKLMQEQISLVWGVFERTKRNLCNNSQFFFKESNGCPICIFLDVKKGIQIE